MRLLVHEIDNEVFQKITPNSNSQISVIRPHLYIKNIPSGHLTVQILSEDDVLIAESDTINFYEITQANEYHGYVRFYINAFLKKDIVYKINLVAGGGYVFNESSYCAICNDYDLRKYSPNYTVLSPWFAPLDIEIWTTSQK